MVQEADELERAVAASLARIAADHDRGAAELAESGLELLEEACEQLAHGRRAALPGKTLLAELRPVVARLFAVRPSMAPIGNAALDFLSELQRAAGRARDCRKSRPWHAVRERLEGRRKANLRALVEGAGGTLGGVGTLLTLSYSSTVTAILLHALPKGARIVVAESRPRLEGRRVVELLLGEGRNVLCITDAQLPLFAARADAVLIGADAVTADLAVINKVGSLAAALAARAAGRPFYAAAETGKINPRVTAAEIELEEKSGEEVWPAHAELCANVYFEPVPAALVTAYLTERGPLDAGAMSGEVERLRRLYAESGVP